jgi:prepilin-type N-terminal cleavage/methylation domain-containing protein
MKKHGFTLIELIAVIVVVAIVMGTAVVLLAQLFEFRQTNDEYANGVRTVNLLITDFRNDVRTYGKPAILSDEDVLLRWTTETKTIEYTAEPGEFPDQQNIIRTVHQDGQRNGYEMDQLPDRTAVHFIEGKEHNVGLIALSLWTAPPRGEMPNLDELNPFDRTFESRADRWRTIVVRY